MTVIVDHTLTSHVLMTDIHASFLVLYLPLTLPRSIPRQSANIFRSFHPKDKPNVTPHQQISIRFTAQTPTGQLVKLVIWPSSWSKDGHRLGRNQAINGQASGQATMHF